MYWNFPLFLRGSLTWKSCKSAYKPLVNRWPIQSDFKICRQCWAPFGGRTISLILPVCCGLVVVDEPESFSGGFLFWSCLNISKTSSFAWASPLSLFLRNFLLSSINRALRSVPSSSTNFFHIFLLGQGFPNDLFFSKLKYPFNIRKVLEIFLFEDGLSCCFPSLCPLYLQS